MEQIFALILFLSSCIDIDFLNNSFGRKYLRATAIQMELLDTREHWILVRDYDFKSDVRLLRDRYGSLYDAPPAADAFRFPDRSCVNEMLAFNRAYLNYLLEARHFNPLEYEWYTEAIRETNECYNIYDLMRDSRCDYYYVTVRRASLKTLKKKLGDVYYSGKYPPYVPVWRFKSLD